MINDYCLCEDLASAEIAPSPLLQVVYIYCSEAATAGFDVCCCAWYHMQLSTEVVSSVALSLQRRWHCSSSTARWPLPLRLEKYRWQGLAACWCPWRPAGGSVPLVVCVKTSFCAEPLLALGDTQASFKRAWVLAGRL